jgi:hypothetical protein
VEIDEDFAPRLNEYFRREIDEDSLGRGDRDFVPRVPEHYASKVKCRLAALQSSRSGVFLRTSPSRHSGASLVSPHSGESGVFLRVSGSMHFDVALVTFHSRRSGVRRRAAGSRHSVPPSLVHIRESMRIRR